MNDSLSRRTSQFLVDASFRDYQLIYIGEMAEVGSLCQTLAASMQSLPCSVGPKSGNVKMDKSICFSINVIFISRQPRCFQKLTV